MPLRLPARASRRRVPALTHDPSSLFQPPEVVGPFRVRRVLASGTLGPRLLVEDDRGRLQVLKLITDVTDDAAALAARLDQARHALPQHPALQPVTDVGVSDDGVYLASPVLNDPSVEGRLRGGRQTLEATLPWLRAVTAGLQAAHEAGVLHGAIHPRDVLVTEDGGVLTGVGIAPALEALKLQAPVRVPFTAPERASGRPWDARADQYSLAMLALDALSGRRLIAGTIPAFDRWTLAETPTEDARLHEVFVRALHPDPDQRYASLEAWLEALAGPASDPAEKSGALSRFAREGVILAAPAANADAARDQAARDIKVQPIEDPEGIALSLFPEEDGTVESPVIDTVGARRDVDPAPGEGDTDADVEQEWLVADVPDDTAPPEPEPAVDPLVMRHEPAPEDAHGPARDWHLDDDDRTVAAVEPPRPWEAHTDEAPGRRPWLVVAVLLVLAALGYGTWQSLNRPPASASSAEAPAESAPDPSTSVSDDPSPTASVKPPRPAVEPSVAPPVAVAPRSVPQAPVTPPRTAPPVASVPAPVREAIPAPPPAATGTGRVLIRSSPSAEVRINGTLRGETPVVLRDLPFGQYAVTISRAGFQTVEREVTLLASQTVASMSVDLVREGTTPAAPVPAAAPPTASPASATPAPARAPAAPVAAEVAPTGGIFVVSTPSQARLFVDGQAYGSTPAAIPGLTQGAHTVRVEAPGFKPWEGRVAVIGGTRVRVQATLQQEQE